MGASHPDGTSQVGSRQVGLGHDVYPCHAVHGEVNGSCVSDLDCAGAGVGDTAES